MNRLKVILFLIISLGIIIIYLLYFNYFKLNYPQHEDVLMGVFVREWDSSSWERRFDEWGKFTFGHRYYYPRAVSFIAAALNGGKLDLNHTMTGGIFMAIFFLLVFGWLLTKSKIHIIYLLPAVFLLFNPQMRAYIFWALTNQLYMPSLLFTLIAIILATRDGVVSYMLLIVSSLLAIGSFSSGLLVLPSVLLVFFVRKKYLMTGLWALLAFVLFALYFRNYNTVGWGFPIIGTREANFSYFYRLLYLLACTGNTVLVEQGQVLAETILRPRFWAPISFGLLSWSVLGYGILMAWFGGWLASSNLARRFQRWGESCRSQYEWFQRNPQIRIFFTAVTPLLFVTIYLVVIGRTTMTDGNHIFERRLKLYPIITEITAYCMALILIYPATKRKWFFGISCAGAVFIWAYSYYVLVAITNIETRFLVSQAFNYKHNANAYLADFGTWGGRTQKEGKKLYAPVFAAGVLDLEFRDVMKNASGDSDTMRLPTVKITPRPKSDYSFSLSGLNGNVSDLNKYSVLLRNDKDEFVVSLTPSRNNLLNFLKTGQYYHGDLEGGIPGSSVPEGRYQVGVLYHNVSYRYQKDSVSFVRDENGYW